MEVKDVEWRWSVISASVSALCCRCQCFHVATACVCLVSVCPCVRIAGFSVSVGLQGQCLCCWGQCMCGWSWYTYVADMSLCWWTIAKVLNISVLGRQKFVLVVTFTDERTSQIASFRTVPSSSAICCFKV